MSTVTIVIPCYNEEASLPELVDQIRKLDVNFEFILVDNGSMDTSQKVLEGLSLPAGVKVRKKEQNTGYGAGIKFGLQHVKTEFAGWMHADLQQNISALNKVNILIERLSEVERQKLVAVKGLRSGRSIIENIFTVGVSFVASTLFARRCWDIAGQPNIFKSSDLSFLEKAPDDHNFEFYVYLKFLLLGGTFKRFDAPFFVRKFGTSSWDNGFISKFHHAKKIFKYLIYLRFNVYR